jgi:hypothetical protein
MAAWMSVGPDATASRREKSTAPYLGFALLRSRVLAHAVGQVASDGGDDGGQLQVRNVRGLVMMEA